MKPRTRKPGEVAPITYVMIVGVAIIIIVLALALGSGDSGIRVPGTDPLSGGDDPQSVHQRTITALEENDPDALYAEFSPSISSIFSLDQVRAGEQDTIQSKGQVLAVQVISPPVLLVGPQWGNEWAEAKVRVKREKIEESFIVRYHLENGQWWFWGTILIP